MDDDTLAFPIRVGQLDAPVQIRSGLEAEEVWPGQPGPSDFVHNGVDLLGSHERLLGRSVAELTGQSSNPLAWVPRTFNGLAGDCGLGPPFGLWEAPLGAWWLSDRSHARLQDESLPLSRRHLRMAEVPTLSNGRCSLSPFFALDNRKVMPPWFPTYRGADRLFPRMFSNFYSEAMFGHVPLALPHEPVNSRNFWPGDQVFQELLETRSGPSWWRDQMAEYVRRLSLAQCQADYWVPLDILGEMPLEQARAHTQQLIRDFGRLLLGWHELVRATQELLTHRPLAASL